MNDVRGMTSEGLAQEIARRFTEAQQYADKAYATGYARGKQDANALAVYAPTYVGELEAKLKDALSKLKSEQNYSAELEAKISKAIETLGGIEE